MISPLLNKWVSKLGTFNLESAGEYAEERLISSIRNFILFSE
jgi:hypothetical protein